MIMKNGKKVVSVYKGTQPVKKITKGTSVVYTDSASDVITLEQSDYISVDIISTSYQVTLDVTKSYNIDGYISFCEYGVAVDEVTAKFKNMRFEYISGKYVMPLLFDDMGVAQLILFANAKTTDGSDLLDENGWATVQNSSSVYYATGYKYTLVITEA